MTYNDSFQDRIANAAKAREKALEKLRAKPPMDAKTVAGLVIVLGCVSWSRFGSATSFDLLSLTPGLELKDVIFWPTIFVTARA